MFGFIKKFFFREMTFFSYNALNTVPLKCVSMSNQECKVRPVIVNINSDESSFYPYSIQIKKCSGSCNNINDPYTKLCVPNVIKYMNVKVFHLMSRTNETRHMKWYETVKCKCRLDASICNNKQRWNDDKFRCECKELIDKGRSDNIFIWNPSNSECGNDKSCDIGQCLDYKNCNCRKGLISKLVEKCSEDVNGNEMIYNGILNEYEKICNSCAVYIMLFVTAFLMIIGISSAYFYFHWYLKRTDLNFTNINANIETVIY